jgi:ribonuclease VapC
VIVLDASALLALLNDKPGAGVVARDAAANDATIGAVNYAEVLQKAARLGVPAEAVDAELDALGITVSPFGRLDARLAASFFRDRSGLSLADRVCLALARSLSSPAYTTDRLCQHWADDLAQSAKRSRSCAPKASAFEKSPDAWGERPRRSPGNCVEMPRPEARRWSIGR